MKTAQVFQEEKEIKLLDTLSGLLVVLFVVALFLFYSFPFIQTVEGEALPTPEVIQYVAFPTR